MQDATPVRRLERICQLHREFAHQLRRHRPAGMRAFDVLEHQIVRADVVDLTDVRVVEGGDRARFRLKPIGVHHRQLLDRDRPIEPRVARTIDPAHAAFADQFVDFVGAEAGAGGNTHSRRAFRSYRRARAVAARGRVGGPTCLIVAT